MPGRKSAVSTTSNGPEEVTENTPSKASKDRDGLSVDDLSLPKSMVARLAKGVLPANTQIHKDALLALHKSATVFVSYLASNSNDNAQASGKKTISPQDVTAALKDAELAHFLPRLEAELKKYNDTQCDKRNTYRRKIKEEKAAAASKEDGGEAPEGGEMAASGANGEDAELADAEASERPVKKLKREDGDAVNPALDDLDDGDTAGLEDDFHDALQDDEDDDEEEEAMNEVVDDFDEDGDEDDGADDVMEDALEEIASHSDIRDEALDDPDSD